MYRNNPGRPIMGDTVLDKLQLVLHQLDYNLRSCEALQRVLGHVAWQLASMPPTIRNPALVVNYVAAMQTLPFTLSDTAVLAANALRPIVMSLRGASTPPTLRSSVLQLAQTACVEFSKYYPRYLTPPARI